MRSLEHSADLRYPISRLPAEVGSAFTDTLALLRTSAVSTLPKLLCFDALVWYSRAKASVVFAGTYQAMVNPLIVRSSDRGARLPAGCGKALCRAEPQQPMPRVRRLARGGTDQRENSLLHV